MNNNNINYNDNDNDDDYQEDDCHSNNVEIAKVKETDDHLNIVVRNVSSIHCGHER